jgi:phosphomannomutase
MNIPAEIFKSYDIRGIYPTQLNEDNIKVIISAIYKFFKSKIAKNKKPITIVVGTDMRISSPILTKSAIKTLVELGAHIIDIGLVSTPSFYFVVNHYNYDAGIQITASHNPKEYNGIKIVLRKNNGLVKIGKPTGMEDIKQLALSNEPMPKSKQGFVEKKTGFLQEEVKNSLRIVGYPKIKRFKIVADAANAMGSQYINALFERIPADLVRMNFELDGTFPAHQPDPLQKETLVDLQKRVIEEEADLGLAPDGDGDRLFLIDEKGNIVPPTIITSIVASELLKKNPGEIIYVDIRYILTPKKIIEESGGKIEIVKVGHAFITEAMNKTHGIFAGESSGHYFFRDTGNAESQMPIILTVLKVMSEKQKALSEIVQEYTRSAESGEINFRITNASEIMEKLKEKYSDGRLNTLDGVAIDYPDWRFSVRMSNTEPLLRLNVESLNQAKTKEKTEELVEFIKSNARS